MLSATYEDTSYKPTWSGTSVFDLADYATFTFPLLHQALAAFGFFYSFPSISCDWKQYQHIKKRKVMGSPLAKSYKWDIWT